MAIDTTQAVRIKTIVSEDGMLQLFGPFRAGENVEVIVLTEPSAPEGERYPLRGTSYSFAEPFAPVADDEWETVK